MKKSYSLLAFILFISATVFGQWCIPTTTPTTMNSYSSASPVITNVTFNTINRTTTAASKELYIYTGEGTSVERGSSVPFSMTFTRDVPVCPEHNLRIWIDWNLDGDFTDTGELALSLDNTTDIAFADTVHVPVDAALGTTRMRVALKMTPPCGHTLPDPCVPSEAVGWHGEIEDYDLTVTTATGIEETNSAATINVYTSNAGVHLDYFLQMHSDVQLEIYNSLGQRIRKIDLESKNSLVGQILINRADFSTAGIYIAISTINGRTYFNQFVLAE